jgi:hypothetical protein
VPTNASSNGARLVGRRPRARSASNVGSGYPASKASSMLRADVPMRSVATAPNLTVVSSRVFCRRLTVRARSCTRLLRERVKSRRSC